MPDVDELEWLAQQQQYYDSDDNEDDHLDPVPLSPSPSPSKFKSSSSILEQQEDKGCRKRLYVDVDGEDDDQVTEKRNRTDEMPFVDDEWLQDPPDHLPVPSQIEKEEKENEWIPRRMAGDIEGDFISITGPSGDRVYAKLNGMPPLSTTSTATRNVNGIGQGLLSEPIHALLEKVEEEMFNQACHAMTEGTSDENHVCSQTTSEQLWVEKYAPKSFTELLSDEKTNREVLRWLKQWDPCVFGSKNTRTSSEVLSALKIHSSISHSHGFVGNKNFSFKGNKGVPPSETHDGKDKWNKSNHPNDYSTKTSDQLKKETCDDRPDEKILLLCGPPGLGKTTLAHVSAKHCGYRVVEINASDDRSASTIEGKILDVVQMNSVMADSKPKCLVIDEIDGALGEGKGAVEVLLKMISSEKKATLDKENDESITQSVKATRKKGPKKTARLSRPVICICNDMFAPALRSLREVARVHTFVQPSTSRVVNRLKYICKKEGFKASAQGLTTLAEFTECDIRACLNTLQFLNRKKDFLNVVDIGSQVVGRKDMTSSIFDIWRAVLQKRKSKVKGPTLDSCKQEGQNFAQLHDIISHHGDYELGVEGIHENFLHLTYHDSAMEKTVKCLDFLCDSNLLTQRTMRSQQFFLYAYQPSIIISIQRLIAQIEKPNIEWPKSHQRYRATLTVKKDLLKLWMNRISPTVSRYLSLDSIVVDVVSSLLYILSPPALRPVASQLLSEKEHGEIIELVNTMIDYAIIYKKGKVLSPNGTQMQDSTLDSLGLCFDPPIHDFVNFQDYTVRHCVLSSAMRQILSHEVEKQKILRESISRTSRANEVSTLPKEASIVEDVKAHVSKGSLTAESTSNLLSTQIQMKNSVPSLINPSKLSSSNNADLQSNATAPTVESKFKLAATVKKSSGSFDFFDRFRKSSQNQSGNNEKSPALSLTSQRDLRPLVFKFNEGFTNAVKRPVRVRDLL